MGSFQLSKEQIADYHRDGYLVIKKFLHAEETDKLQKIAFEDGNMRKHAFDLNDQSGKKTRLTLWYQPGDDAYGLLTRSKRMVASVDKLMDGTSAVCHFHSKLMQKEPKVGGAWEWHQDYGYWYKNEFLIPSQYLNTSIPNTFSGHRSLSVGGNTFSSHRTL